MQRVGRQHFEWIALKLNVVADDATSDADGTRH